jgi:GntR family transcriptional regulator
LTESILKKPKYLLLKNHLQELIDDMAVEGKDCLPSERELGEKYGVSRITIRRAMAELEQEGKLYRIRGKGAFICKEKIPQTLSKLTSFTDDMRLRNMKPDSRILELDYITAGPHIAGKLRIAADEPVVLLKRLRLADGEPMAIETCYMRRDIGSMIMDRLNNGESLYELMQDHCGIELAYAKQTIEVCVLKGWEKKLLGNGSPSYALFTCRLTFDENDVPVEYVESKYRSDRYRFQVDLSIR